MFLSLKIVFILANSVYPDEMPHHAAFHLGLHCLPKSWVTGIQNEKGKKRNLSVVGIVVKKTTGSLKHS